MPAASLRVDYKPATVARFATGLQPRLRLLNTGISSVALANTEIRYWFAQEGGGTHLADLYDVRIMPSGQSVIGTCSAKVVPDAQGGQSHVLKLSFGPAAGGLPAGSYVEFQLQVHTSNWSTYDQANDYSYAAWPEVRPQPMVAAYFGGTLVWGSEPGAGSTTRVSLARPEPDDKKGVGVPEAERILSAVSIPNPATTGTLTLAYQSDGKAEQVLLELFSAGQVQVARSEWPGPSDAGWHRTTMDLSGLPNGAYTARLRLRSGAGLSRPYATTVIILR